MKTVVFLGPTLPIAEARRILDALYLPPARQSDLVSAVHLHHPDAIILIDGCFYHSLSIWHKEILYALERGVMVFGGASLGALRAAELAPFGMVGMGRIFELYRDGLIEDDDEVVLSHGDADTGFRAHSLPMVNVRATLESALLKKAASPETIIAVMREAKAIYFADRTVPEIFRRSAMLRLPSVELAGLERFFVEEWEDLKREDACKLLRHVQALSPDHCPRQQSTPLQRSLLFEAQFQRECLVRRDTPVRLETIAQHAALHMGDFDDFNFAASNFAFVQRMADFFNVEVNAEDVKLEARRFRIKRHLVNSLAYADWLGRNDLDEVSFTALMNRVARSRRMHRWLSMREEFCGKTQMLLDLLRLTDRYESIGNTAAEESQMVGEDSNELDEHEPANLPLPERILNHLRSTECQMPVHYAVWAEEAGFDDLIDFSMALNRARVARLRTTASTLEPPP